MAKGSKNRKNRDDASANSGQKRSAIIHDEGGSTTTTTTMTKTKGVVRPLGMESSETSSSSQQSRRRRRSLYQWCLLERQGIVWVLGCAFLGWMFGFGIGTGWLVGEWNNPPNPWRIGLGIQIRTSDSYTILISSMTTLYDGWLVGNDFITYSLSSILGDSTWLSSSSSFSSTEYGNSQRRAMMPVRKVDPSLLVNNPSHPFLYAVLREAIVREKGGYVHPDLGILEPAPCGAARGIGMVRNIYHNCQIHCVPGLAKEKLEAKMEQETCGCDDEDYDNDDDDEIDNHDDDDCVGRSSGSCANHYHPHHHGTDRNPTKRYMQEEVLIKVPLNFQMTRKVALDELLPRVSVEVQRKASIHELDDAALLTLLLAHERGVGQYSRWLPYISVLPHEPSCGYSLNLRPHVLDSIHAMGAELGLDVKGWPDELRKATKYAQKIVNALAKDYGPFLQHPKGMSAQDNIQWALCHVASRAVGGSQKFGALRLVPLVDMLNHDADAGGMVELTGEERLEEGDFVDAIDEDDEGAFVVRSLRHGIRKALRVGQELLVNYNVPQYSALDWLVSSGFVPPERLVEWQKLDAPLRRVRRDGPFASLHEGIGNGPARPMWGAGSPPE